MKQLANLALVALIASLKETHRVCEYSDGERERIDRAAHIAFLEADLAEREAALRAQLDAKPTPALDQAAISHPVERVEVREDAPNASAA